MPGRARALGAPGVAVPLPLTHACTDERYPALAGPWAVGCGPGGEVDRAVNVETGAVVRLPEGYGAPALGPGLVLDVDRRGTALFRLDGDAVVPVPGLARFLVDLVAPPGFDGEHLALLASEHLDVGAPTERASRRYPARPAGWYPPALAWPWVAWVADGGETGEDIWAVDTATADPPFPLAASPGYERHVIGHERWLAWVEDDAVVVLDTRDQSRRRLPAETGFSAPIALWRDVVCWESRAGHDLDVLCSDGHNADGPGHQQAPSRWGPYLLYRFEGRAWLATAP